MSTVSPLPPENEAAAANPRAGSQSWLETVLGVVSGLLVVLVLMVAVLAGTAWWSARTAHGSAWLLSVLPGVEVVGARGVLLGDFDAERVTVRIPAGAGPHQVTVTGLGWRGLKIESAASVVWARVVLSSFFANRVDVALAPSKTPAAPNQPLHLPGQIRLPIELEVGALRINELHATQGGTSLLGNHPLRNIQARLHLSVPQTPLPGTTSPAQPLTEHHVDELSLGWDRLRLCGQIAIDTHRPFILQAALGASAQHRK
jgi:translocation and assembly module TamB